MDGTVLYGKCHHGNPGHYGGVRAKRTRVRKGTPLTLIGGTQLVDLLAQYVFGQ
jgi:hypothetical protein